jgi:hypothetical protein
MAYAADDPASFALFHRYVTLVPGWRRRLGPLRPYVSGARARYLSLLSGLQPPGVPDRTGFATALARDARRISDAELARLLDFDWRARLTAAYLIGLDQRSQFRDRIGSALLESEFVYAGRGYCFALSRFGQPEDATILSAYLDRYLPRTDCYYDQGAAVGALLYLDQKLGTDHTQPFIAPGGLWHRSAFAEENPLDHRETMEELCAIADELMGTR